VAGLGNPGRRYRSTRHNAGFAAADLLIHRGSVLARGKWADGELALLETPDGKFLVLKPSTYMNDSGRAVAPVLQRYGIAPGQVVVIHDDIDIPLGEVRVKKGGGTGGHRGLSSLVESIGGGEFTRVRIGVGRPPEGVDPAEYVLTGFEEGERESAAASTERAAQAAIDLLRGVERGSP
jgi:peptidyl-tRNA hydrolase, PTH1 family